jgi:hypothetical protein
MDNSKCVILVPAHQYIEPLTELALRQLESRGYRVRRLYGHANPDRARNRLASDAINEGMEELMWVDPDIGFEPHFVDILRHHNLPLVGGLYPSTDTRALACQLLPGTAQVNFGPGGGILEIQAAAAGFFYTRRQVYLDIQEHEKLPVCDELTRPVIPYFLPMVLKEGKDHRYLCDAYAFCERARRCGYRLFADTTLRLQHLGTYGYSWEDAGGGVERYESYRLNL